MQKKLLILIKFQEIFINKNLYFLLKFIYIIYKVFY